MSDSTLHIGTLASNNVNNIVNDTSKYDEYKEKVKDLEKELQTRYVSFAGASITLIEYPTTREYSPALSST